VKKLLTKSEKESENKRKKMNQFQGVLQTMICVNLSFTNTSFTNSLWGNYPTLLLNFWFQWQKYICHIPCSSAFGIFQMVIYINKYEKNKK